MYIHRLNKENLVELGTQGYRVVVCKDEEEQLGIYNTLKRNGRCARAALVKNREGQKISIILTKEREKRQKSSLTQERKK